MIKYLLTVTVALLPIFFSQIASTGNSATESESKTLNSIETIIDSRDVSKTGYLQEIVRKNASPAVRSRAVGALMLMKEKSSNALFADKLIHDPSPEVRVAAAYAMCEEKSYHFISPLSKALKDDDDQIVRAISARAIGFQGIVENGNILISYVMNDPSYQVRMESAAALAKLKILRAVDPLKIVAVNDSDKLVRIAAIKALVNFIPEVRSDFFFKEFETASDLDIRFELYKGVISMQNRDRYLEVGLNDRDERMRFIALKKITETMDYHKRGSQTSQHIALLKIMLNDPFKGIRELANDTLNRLGYKTKDLGVRYEVVR